MPMHPYVEFENTPAWNVLSDVISDLEENQDLKLSTLKEYIVGYICRKLSEEKLLTETAINTTDL